LALREEETEMPEWMLVPKIGVLLAERLVKTYLSTLLFCSNVAEHVDHIAISSLAFTRL